ncbi:MAG: GntR family transcriptional regulator [Armatimonadota bacterium]|nr:GntR family transcriptional regulator [Armatimonadota bacterium]MDR7532673.1 GntR family transcriptional regulator [Armatimonadota bacterium]MDR7536324.1 GntR family transcriptional regulator [Armatimonadota bacterium]
MTFDRLRDRRTLAEMVAADLRERMAAGRLPMGAALNQFALARELGVSRAVVREAFRQLEAAGILRLTPYQHAVVTPLGPEDLDDLWVVRTTLETLAARRAAQRPEAAAVRLGGLVEAMAREQRAEAWLDLDRRFHQEIAELAGNPLLPKLLDAVRMPIDRFIQSVAGTQPRMRSANLEHRALLAALARGDAAEASVLVREHIVRTRRFLARRLDRAPRPLAAARAGAPDAAAR